MFSNNNALLTSANGRDEEGLNGATLVATRQRCALTRAVFTVHRWCLGVAVHVSVASDDWSPALFSRMSIHDRSSFEAGQCCVRSHFELSYLLTGPQMLFNALRLSCRRRVKLDHQAMYTLLHQISRLDIGALALDRCAAAVIIFDFSL